MRAPTLAVIVMFGLAVKSTAEAIHDFSDYTEPSLIAQHDFGDIHPDHNLVDGPRAQPVHKHVLSNQSTGNLLNITKGKPTPTELLSTELLSLNMGNDMAVGEWPQLQQVFKGIVDGILHNDPEGTFKSRQKLHDDLRNAPHFFQKSRYQGENQQSDRCKYPNMLIQKGLAKKVDTQFTNFIFDLFQWDEEKVIERHRKCDSNAEIIEKIGGRVHDFLTKYAGSLPPLLQCVHFVLTAVPDNALKARMGGNIAKNAFEKLNDDTPNSKDIVLNYFLES